MARLTFSNVPTSTGGVISGNISTGAGSPFGSGGKYADQVSDIKATIAKAPIGTYDPKYWDSFLQMDAEKIPEGYNFIPSDDPSITQELLKITSVQQAIQCINEDRGEYFHKQPQSFQVAWTKRVQDCRDEIALHVNRLMMNKNAPLINAIEKQQRQIEIDQAVKLALEQKIRETAKPKTETSPEIVESSISYSPLMIAGVIAVVVILLLKRRRA